jgi:hypothetical protein
LFSFVGPFERRGGLTQVSLARGVDEWNKRGDQNRDQSLKREDDWPAGPGRAEEQCEDDDSAPDPGGNCERSEKQ